MVRVIQKCIGVLYQFILAKRIRRFVCFLLVISMIFSNINLTSFLYAPNMAYADIASSSNADTEENINMEEDIEENIETNIIENTIDTDSIHIEENNVLLDGALEGTSGFFIRPDDSNLIEIGNFKVQISTEGIIIWGFKDGFSTDTLDIPDTLITNGGQSLDVIEIGEDAFALQGIQTLTLGEKLKKIGLNSFAGNQIHTLIFPDSIVEIGKEAFRDNFINNIDLNKIEIIGESAFFNNRIEGLDLGDSLLEIHKDAFRNNQISAVILPDTLTKIESGAFSYNGKYVRVETDMNPLPENIPARDMISGGFGYVINPIHITISYKDRALGGKIILDTVLESDLTSNNEIYVLGMMQTYPIPTIPGYTAVENSGYIHFTPDRDHYQVDILYDKIVTGLKLIKDDSKIPMISPFSANATEEEVKQKLLEYIIATDDSNADLKEQVEFGQANILETIRTATDGSYHDVEYILKSSAGEECRINIRILIGTDMKQFPLDNGWVLGDFTYGGDVHWNGNRDTVVGFSPQGKAKLMAGNRDVVLPHINPTTGTRITKTSYAYGNADLRFSDNTTNGIQTLRDFDDNIIEVTDYSFRNSTIQTVVLKNVKKIGHNAFSSNQLHHVDMPSMEVIESHAFLSNANLTEIELHHVKKIGGLAFLNTGLTKAIAPNVVSIGDHAFHGTKIGADPTYPKGFYMPLLTSMGTQAFYDTELSYIDRDEQMPLMTHIKSSAFAGSKIKSVRLLGVTDIDDRAFFHQDQVNGTRLEMVDLPDAIRIGANAFSHNSIGINAFPNANEGELHLPNVQSLGVEAFHENKIKNVVAPVLREVQGGSLSNNLLTEIRLPSLITASGERSFANNKIKEAYLDTIQSLGKNVFYTPYWPNQMHDRNAYNPGIQALGNLIPIYTNTNDIPSKENYIINPPRPDINDFMEDDFTWDTTNPGKVTGLTPKGKAKMVAKDYNLVIPDRATSVSDNAFYNQKIKTVTARQIVEVGISAFQNNALSKITMPMLTTIGNYAFASNNAPKSDSKLKEFDFSKVTTLGQGAFDSAGLSGKIILPLLREVPRYAFANNMIVEVEAPLVTKVFDHSFYNNRLDKLDHIQFPALVDVQQNAFHSNPVNHFSLDHLTYSFGSGEFMFTNTKNQIIWKIPENIRNYRDDISSFSGNTFHIYIPQEYGGNHRYVRPGAILLTNEVNADGTLNRNNPKGYKEVSHKTSFYNGNRWVGNVPYRRAIINPSTVKVQYRIENTNETFDGSNQKPNIPDYREYIYEEIEPRDNNTGAYAAARKYYAPQIPGYVLVSSTDANGMVEANRSFIEVPFETEGTRTDREITFTYRKIEVSTNPNIILNYYAKQSANSPKVKELTYSTNWDANHPQMNTVFDLDRVGSTAVRLQNPKLYIRYDSPFIDHTKTIVAEDAVSRNLYDDGAWVSKPGSVEIYLKNNLDITTVENINIGFWFTQNKTPNLAKVQLKMQLTDTINGVETIIAQADPVVLTRDINPNPYLDIRTEANITGYPYSNLDPKINGPRFMGEMTGENTSGGLRVIENPGYVTYRYTLSQVYYPIQGYELRTYLPSYTAVDPITNQEITRTAVFDAHANPGWVLSADGRELIYKHKFETATVSSDDLQGRMPALLLKFPGIKENTPVEAKAYATLINIDDPTTSEPAIRAEARGDMGIGDNHIIYPISYKAPNINYTGLDFDASKESKQGPRANGLYAYLYDSPEDRAKEIPYLLTIGSTNEMFDYKDVSVIDYGLDERLYYKSITFTQSPNEVGNMRVKIMGYTKNGAEIDPDNDHLIISREVEVNKIKSVIFPNSDIDYIWIKLLNTEQEALTKYIQFQVNTAVKNPDTILLDRGNTLINHAMFVGTLYKKGTTELADGFIKPNDAKYINIHANSIIESKAQVYIHEYQLNIALSKELVLRENATNYPAFPSYTSGQVVIGGQEGFYHLRLDTSVTGNQQDRGSDVLQNFEVMDVFPESMELKESDIILNEDFIRAGGQFELIGEYPTMENGLPVTKRAIRFFAETFDMRKYENRPYIIARIKTKFLGDTHKNKLSNKAYASWDEKPGVTILNPAQEGNRQIDPSGATSTKKWSYSSQDIRVTVASALVGSLKIRNHRDKLWTSSTRTFSDEPFDYRMSVKQLDIHARAGSYHGIELVNILPGVNDNQQSKSGLRGSQFSNEIDMARFSTDFKVYIQKSNGSIQNIATSDYTMQYHNTIDTVDRLLRGKTLDEFVDDTTTTWENIPNANTKAVKLKLADSVELDYGDEVVIELPMKAPHLIGLNDTKIEKKAVDSFSLRFYRNGANQPEIFREMNNVENIMQAPRGKISFIKYGKMGRLISDSQATPLQGAGFTIVNHLSNETKVAYSDENGKVTFENLDVRAYYTIRESSAPEGYLISTNTFGISGSNTMATAPNYEYMILDDNTNNGIKAKFMNIKPVIGSITIEKQSANPNVKLANISFQVRGISNTNNMVNTIVTTGADGRVSIPNLPEGNYSIQELESSEINRFITMGNANVVIDHTNPNPVKVFTNDTVQVLFKKIITDIESDLDPNHWDRLTDFGKKRVAGYRFRVTDPNGVTVMTNYTDQNGEVVLRNLKTETVYTVTEEAVQAGNTSVLYTHNNREYQFKVTLDGKVVNGKNGNRFRQYSMNFPNMPKKLKGKIVVKKTDENANPLIGAKFILSKVTYGADGSIASSTPIGSPKTTVMQGNDAEVIFYDLDPGTYQVKEISPPLGYYLGAVPETVTVTIPNQVSETELRNPNYDFTGQDIIYTSIHTIRNKRTMVEGVKGEDIEGYQNIPISQAQEYIANHPEYRIRKIGDGIASVYKPLQGVVFELYQMQNGVKVGNALSVNGNTDIVSDVEGKLDFTGFLFDFNTEYGVFEKTALPGYEKLVTPKIFKISTEATRTDFNGIYTFHMNNKKLDASILVSKYDSVTRRALPGAVFRLYQGHNPIPADSSGHIREITTGRDGFAFFGELETGEYTIREYAAPNGYREPYTNTRDKQITLTIDNKNQTHIAYNTKVTDIQITKKWLGGSEASTQVRLMRRANNETTFSPVVGTVKLGRDGVIANTDTNGIIDLNLENQHTVVFPQMPLANELGRTYIYQAEEVSVTDADGIIMPVVNNQIADKYSVLIGGNIQNGFTIQNISYNQNKRSVMVSKSWEFADGSTIALQGSKVVVALMEQVGNETPTEIKRQTLDTRNAWTYTFANLEKRRAGKEVTYQVMEVSDTTGFTSIITEDVNQRTENSNVYTIQNTAKKREKIEITKEWKGVDPANAPQIILDLYNSEKNTIIASQPVTLQADGSWKAIFTDIPSYSYSVESNAHLIENDIAKGRIVAKKIKYAIKERYADGVERPAYTFTSDLDDIAYANYSQDADITNNLSFTLVNKMATQEVKIVKDWIGVDLSEAPNIEIELLDITDDTTENHIDTTSHISLGTRILEYDAIHPENSFVTIFQDLPRYRVDGKTEIQYLVKENTQLRGYDGEVSNPVRIDETHMQINLTNTRKTKNLQFSKQWNMAIENYLGGNANTPDVLVDILADATEDGMVNPTPYLQNGKNTQAILLSSNSPIPYMTRMEGMYQYAPDGITELKYYIKERDILGYIPPEDINAIHMVEGKGRIALVDIGNNTLSGVLLNTQETIDLHASVEWVGLEKYTEMERANLPVPHLEVWDRTNPNLPKRVRANIPMILVEDISTPNRARWTANMIGLPKYLSDGSTAIIYEVVQREQYVGYKTIAKTKPINQNGEKISIWDINGKILNDRTTTTTRLMDARVWEANIVNTVKVRDISVQKIWEGVTGTQAVIHLFRDGIRIFPTATTPITLTEHTPGQMGNWQYTYKNLPYTAIDGNHIYSYHIEEDDIPMYTKTIQSHEIHLPNIEIPNLRFDVINTFRSIDITVTKNWVGVNSNLTPEIQLQLMDITNPLEPIPVLGKIAVLNQNNGYKVVLENLPKVKADGITEIKYGVKEIPELSGYQLEYQTQYSNIPTPDSIEGTATILATNTRVYRKIRMKKIWKDIIDGHRPNVEYKLYADETPDGLENPVEIREIAGMPVNIFLTEENRFQFEMEVPKYAPDGITEILYYISEVPISGYQASVTDKLLLTLDTDTQEDILIGEIQNKIVPMNVMVTNEWQGLEVYGVTIPDKVPDIHVMLYDITNPNHPIKIGEEALLVKDPNDNKYKVSFYNLPKYKPDGVTEIRYTVRAREMEDGSLPGYIGTASEPVADIEGNLTVTLTNRPRTRKIMIHKIWKKEEEAPSVESYIMHFNQKTFGTEIPINGTSRTHIYTDVPYYELDGKTVRNYYIFAYEPEGYILDIDRHLVPSQEQDRRYTDLVFDILLKRGKRRSGESGVRSTNVTKEGSKMPNIHYENLVIKTPTEIEEMTPLYKTETEIVLKDGNQIWIDTNGKITRFGEEDNNIYFSKDGRLIPKTGDTKNLLLSTISILTGGMLLVLWGFGRKKIKNEEEI